MRSFALRLAATLLLGASLAAHAQAPKTVFLEEMTSPELSSQIRAGKSTLIVPIGGTEQNGPHMALGKPTSAPSLPRRLPSARQRDRRPGDCLCARGRRQPADRACVIPARSPFPVTPIGVSNRQHAAPAAGFRDIVLLGDSGDYQKDDLAWRNNSIANGASNVRAPSPDITAPTVWFGRH
jgi:hypothetical protein